MAGIFDVMTGAQSSAGNKGWSSFGESLGQAMSGGAGSKTYDEAMLRGHKTQKALMDAQKASKEYQALSALSFEGVIPEHLKQYEPLLTNYAISGGNMDQFAKSMDTLERQRDIQRAREAAASGDVSAMNDSLAIYGGKPRQATKVEGNTLIDPYAAMTDQTPRTTDYGDRSLDIREKRVAGQNAASMASATRPRASGGGRAGAAGDSSAHYQKEFDRVLKEAAQGALSDAKLRDYDVTGLTVTDVMHALRTTGVFTTRDGHDMATWDTEMSPETFAAQASSDFSNVMTGSSTVDNYSAITPLDDSSMFSGGTKESQPPPAAAPGQPAPAAPGFSTPSAAMSAAPVTEPKGQPSRQDPGLPPMLDYISGGNVGDSARPSGAMPPPASAGSGGSTVQIRIQQARDALARGADPVQVRQMLGSMGIDPKHAGL